MRIEHACVERELQSFPLKLGEHSPLAAFWGNETLMHAWVYLPLLPELDRILPQARRVSLITVRSEIFAPLSGHLRAGLHRSSAETQSARGKSSALPDGLP